MADGSIRVESKSKIAPGAAAAKRADSPDIYPDGTQMRLCTVAMALEGVRVLFNDLMDGSDKGCGVMATLDLVVDELTRINNEMEAFTYARLKQGVAHG